MFVESSGLCENASKSAIYIVGIPECLKIQIAQQVDFPLGSLPFRYLGMALTSKRISVANCEVLMNKMTARVRS